MMSAESRLLIADPEGNQIVLALKMSEADAERFAKNIRKHPPQLFIIYKAVKSEGFETPFRIGNMYGSSKHARVYIELFYAALIEGKTKFDLEL